MLLLGILALAGFAFGLLSGALTGGAGKMHSAGVRSGGFIGASEAEVSEGEASEAEAFPAAAEASAAADHREAGSGKHKEMNYEN